MCKMASLKDKLLKGFITKDIEKGLASNIAKELDTPIYLVYKALQEMCSEGHIEVIPATSIHGTDCGVRRIMPKGELFYRTSSYRKQARIKWFEEVPKKYWWVAALFAVISFGAPLYLQYYNKLNQPSNQTQPTVQKPKNDTTKGRQK